MRVSKLFDYTFSFVAVLATAVALHYLKDPTIFQKEQISLQSQPSSLSVVVQDHLKHPRKDLRHLKKHTVHALDPLTDLSSESNVADANLSAPSEEELQEFPGATVVEATEVEGPEPNQTTQIKILQTDFKYPFVRSEDVVDNDTGNVVDHEEMAADHLLVSLPEGTDPTVFLNTLGPEVTSMIPVTPGGSSYILPLSSPSIALLPQLLDTIAASDPFIVVGPDVVHHIPPTASHNSTFTTHWGLDKIVGELNQFTSFSKESPSASKLVALIDTGIRDTHNELKPNMWHNPSPNRNDFYGWNALANNGDTCDDNGHGTFCAGVIGAVGNNNQGIIGVVPKVQLMACKAFDNNGTGVVSDEIKSIHYACEHGAKVLNCSWGGGPSQLLYNALSYAQEAGVICVAAAGNDGSNENFYPAAYGTTDSYEGRKLDNVVSVAASTEADTLASFSNYGNVSLAAPGTDICSSYSTADDAYAVASGTSMATPYVTGAVVLLETQFSAQPYNAVISKLYNTADRVAGLTGKVTYGRLNITKALSW